MWGGRFDERIDTLMARFNNSFPFDQRLWREDIRGSMAWTRQLAQAGVISAEERDTLLAGLEAVFAEFADGRFEAHPTDEDIHTAVERRLGEIVGAVAGKLHTGRSRNDQVATDVRLWTIGAIQRIDNGLRTLQQALLAQAEAAGDALMPGYTHLQRAQPVLLAHWLLSHFWPLQRDRERLADCAKRTAVLPLGSGALAGTSLAIDRMALAADLGMATISPNSIDAVSDRDFIAEFLFCAALIGAHLSRLAEDMIMYSSAEFGFVVLADAYSTGSSLMPQKKNPDSFELLRGKAGRLIGDLTTMLTVLKGLPSAYNKDLQEDKEPLFDAADTLELALPVAAGAVATARFRHDRMRAALDDAMLATDVADYLVARGVPFREAHSVVGRLVREAEQRGVALSMLPREVFLTAHPACDDGVLQVFNVDRSVAQRRVSGATAPEAVREQIAQARRCVEEY
ncbi:MAG: argininosuccinate lyase [Roseiflexus sp.]|nr:argininosuccinate lyase [Roseiflexus sp.]MCS7287727.1 argininosuccinate lyase [Roseiflexus sp.]MDW8147926.1 argininosuccinate lyase [Roseiflexaceae bacterium]MDW8231961.1 argininosuccinate lyase [Roseiflexaceae bacterium]